MTPEEREYKRRADALYYERHKEKVKARVRARYWADPERHRAAARERARRDPEGALERYQRWLAKPGNAEIADERKRRYWQEHPEQRQKHAQLRRARKAGALVEVVERDEVYRRAGGICGWCREPVDPASFHVDHIVALCLGGDHSYANTQPTHPACNIAKRVALRERAA